jgi:enterochelin esterase-like enzyme
MKKLMTILFTIFALNTVGLPQLVLASDSESRVELSSNHESSQQAMIHSDMLKQLHAEFLEAGDEEGFWQEIAQISDSGNYPFVEELQEQSYADEDYIQLTFLHREGESEPDNVMFFASINHVLAEELLFEKITGTGVYFKSVEVPRGVRFSYRIIENDPLTGLFASARIGSRLHLLGGDPDPFNPNKTVFPGRLMGRDYIETWVELEGAASQPYLVEQGNSRGEVLVEERASRRLGYSHNIHTYLPPEYDPQSEYPLLILFDAQDYFNVGSLQTTLENLIADGSIPPLLVLGINAGTKNGQDQRNYELTASPLYREYLQEELLPWFTSKYNISPDPERRVIAGSSFGGLFSAYFAFSHPESVANVISQSGSFHWGKREEEFAYEWLTREFAFAERKPISLFMEVGMLEAEYHLKSPYFPHQILSNRHFKTVLDMKGYDVFCQEYAGGHEMLSWRGGIAEGLKHVFEVSSAEFNTTASIVTTGDK